MKKLSLDNYQDVDKLLADAWLNIQLEDSDVEPQFLDIPEGFLDKPELYITWVMSQPDFFSFTCKELLGIQLLPFQGVVLKELWTRKFPMMICCRGFGKTFLLAVYSLLSCIFGNKEKVIVCGSAFRQAKMVFAYMEEFISDSSILKDIIYFNSNKQDPIQRGSDNYQITIGNSFIKGLPLGTGEKIRGNRATKIITDEFASIPIDIFETVIAGFGIVSSNPVDKVQKAAREKLAKKLGIELVDSEGNNGGLEGNQLVLSGTASYDFNHFARYHKQWSEIIKSQGEPYKLAKAMNLEDGKTSTLSWKDFSIIRIPTELMPDMYIDPDQLERSRATMTSSNFLMEMSTCFSKDSQGFFKRTMIEQCVVKPGLDWVLPGGNVIQSEEIFFEPMLRGDPRKEYVFAIDPAARLDNFSIIILERNIGYRKLVYCWTTNEKRHKKMADQGFTKEKNYYAYCCRKIRDLMMDFNCVGIGIDYGGGGGAIINGLQDEDKMDKFEKPLYHHIDYKKLRDTDGNSGLHIIYEVNFTSDWSAQANHTLRKDMEDRIVVFPYIDGISYALADDELSVEEMEQSKDKPISIDPYSEVIYEIEELKNELSMIVVSETATGREHWDTPELKTNTGKKSRLRKDRYSALLIANDTCRLIFQDESLPKISATEGGGFASIFKSKEQPKGLFTGPDWITKGLSAAYD